MKLTRRSFLGGILAALAVPHTLLSKAAPVAVASSTIATGTLGKITGVPLIVSPEPVLDFTMLSSQLIDRARQDMRVAYMFPEKEPEHIDTGFFESS